MIALAKDLQYPRYVSLDEHPAQLNLGAGRRRNISLGNGRNGT